MGCLKTDVLKCLHVHINIKFIWVSRDVFFWKIFVNAELQILFRGKSVFKDIESKKHKRQHNKNGWNHISKAINR
jgi:hypothetical protein